MVSGALLAILAISCSGDENNPSYSVENPLDSFHQQAGLTEIEERIDERVSEVGLVFSPNANGVMNGITVKLPVANPELRVLVWDYDTEEVLRAEFINVSSPDVVTTKDIPELALEKNKKYVITMYSNDWYLRRTVDDADVAYPITAGSIKILEYRYIDFETAPLVAVFPTIVRLDRNRGDLSFNFKRTE